MEATAVAPAESASPTSEAGLEASDPTYYAARQLDVYPTLVTALDFGVPKHAGTTEAGATVLLLVHIGATGTVDGVSVLEAEPAGYFEQDARRALESAQFRPAIKNGRPVRSRILVHVDYGKTAAGSR